MKKHTIIKKFFSMLLCLCVSLTLFTTMTVSATSTEGGSAAEYSEQTAIGEVINSVEQGATGTYTIPESGYYVINLRGADGGDGQDVHIQSDGVGSTDECKGNAYGYGGSGASGGAVSTLVYLEKGQTISYEIGVDGTNYTEEAYRYEDLQRGCIHVYPNSNPIYKPDEYVDAGYGGGGGGGTWVSVDDVVIAGAAGGGGGGGSVASCANWGEGSYYGFKDPSGHKNTGANGGDATAVSSEISETFVSVLDFDGQDGTKSQGESVQTGEYWPAVTILWKELAPKAPKYKLTAFEAGAGGVSGTSYINKDSKFYYGDDIPSDVSASDAYINAASPETSGIIITFVYKFAFPCTVEFGDGTSCVVTPGESVTIEIPKPSIDCGYFKGWVNAENTADTLIRDYYGDNTVTLSYENSNGKSYNAEVYDTSRMGMAYVSNAKAQAVVLANGDKAIRFIALIDAGYESYKRAGFILSAECPTPTIEAGYQYSTQSKLYKKVRAKSAQTGAETYIDVAAANTESTFGLSAGAGFIYTNLVVNGKENKTYHATPYIVDTNGAYVYGQAKTISYDVLKQYDAAVSNEQ